MYVETFSPIFISINFLLACSTSDKGVKAYSISWQKSAQLAQGRRRPSTNLQLLVQPSLGGVRDASSNHINPDIGRIFYQPEVPFHLGQPSRYCWDTAACVLFRHFQFQSSDSHILRHSWSKGCRCLQCRSSITHSPQSHGLYWDARRYCAWSFNWWLFMRKSTHHGNRLLHILFESSIAHSRLCRYWSFGHYHGAALWCRQ